MSNSRREVVLMSVLLSVAIAYATWDVWSLRWVTDDAFISFRYAQNLCRGLGLVFNAGERVEGYTNFLWTLLVAVGMKFRIDPVTWTAVLGAASYFLTVGTFVALSWKRFERDTSRTFLPLAALCLLFHHDSHVYATGGLETAWTTLFISLSFALLLFAEGSASFALAGGLLTIAALSRPDALLFLFSSLIFALIMPGARLRRATMLILVPLVVYVPYWLWRYHYYGFPFPNTYYAKSAGLSYFSQGITYLWLYVKSYYVLGLAPLALLWLAWPRRKDRSTTWFARPALREAILITVFLLPYSCYVVKVGGDFMFARFWLPVTGIAFYALECACQKVFWRPLIRYAVGACVLAMVLWRYPLYSGTSIIQGVADEPAFYPREWHERAQREGARMRELFKDRDVRVAFFGRYAMWVYYADPHFAIEAETGLTDTTVAHQPLEERGRPGHEKHPTKAYLLQRRVQFIWGRPLPVSSQADRLRAVRFGDFDVRMLSYDRTLMEALAKDSTVVFTDFPKYLDRVVAHGSGVWKDQAEGLLTFAREFYFDFNEDPERLQKLMELAGGQGAGTSPSGSK